VEVVDDLASASMRTSHFSYTLDNVMICSLMLKLVDRAHVILHLAGLVGISTIQRCSGTGRC